MMTGSQLGKARERKEWTQQHAAARLGVSQAYLSLLERGQRPLTPRLRSRAVQAYGLRPTLLPLKQTDPKPSDSQELAEDLSALGYTGFAYMRTRRRRNPAEVLAKALKQEYLEARLVEALPWVLLRYPDLNWRWLLDQARLHNLQNRLGFLVAMARHKAEEKGELETRRYRNLRYAEEELERSRLAQEDAFGQASFTPGELQWLHEHRPELAARWNLLSDLCPEHLPYAG